MCEGGVRTYARTHAALISTFGSATFLKYMHMHKHNNQYTYGLLIYKTLNHGRYDEL